MRNLLLPILCCLGFTTNAALAQSTTVFHETFQGGLPPTWSTHSVGTALWHLATNGECGAVTNMAAHNHGPAACDYMGVSFDDSLVSPPIMLAAGAPNPLVAFDYILDTDVQDVVVLAQTSSSGSYLVFATSESLVNDGAIHSAAFDLFYLLEPPFATQLVFSAASDGVGDQGRGILLDNVRVSSVDPGSFYCNGATAALCPCSNAGGVHRGCANSTGSGALLRGSGDTSVAADSLQLFATNLPPTAPTLFFQGSAQASQPFGDGRRCVGGLLVRLGTKTSQKGNAVYPELGDVRISTLSAVAPGQTRYYQALYRDVSGPCGTGFNLSNGWSAPWTP